MRILYVTTISLTMNSFFKPHIEMLVGEGHHVDIACNSRDLPLDSLYEDLGCSFYQVDFSRSVLCRDNVKAYGQLKKIVAPGKYDIVHCHTPNASVITRLVCRSFRQKTGLKVFYTAHGFHFFRGAPKLNWFIFYPVERLCSRFTDKLITINHEDYHLAKNRFHTKGVYYVPGVGFDFLKYRNAPVDIAAKRREIGVPENAFLLLSVGELNENKNHQMIIRSMAKLKNPNLHYAIAGTGDKAQELQALADSFQLSPQVHLLGYRKDVHELNHCADLFCFPSIREGLGLSAVEAMACSVPVVAAENRGTRTFLIHGKNGYMCPWNSVESFADIIGKLMENPKHRSKIGAEGCKTAEKFSIERVLSELRSIYNI